MLRLLIIDDEPYIVEWVYDLFRQQDQLELDIQKAYSAAEALALLDRARIDIVITDIQMPEMDGIALMRAIKRNWPECRVVFLTAHDEFEYAHIASRDGVRYVLKTEPDEEIVAAVRKTAAEIEQAQWQQEILESARRQMALYRPVLQRDFLRNLLQGFASDAPVQIQLDELGIPLQANGQVLLLIGRTVRDSDGTLFEKAHESAAADAVVDGCLMSGTRRMAVRFDNGVGVWFLQPDADESWERTLLGMKGALESLQNRFGSSRNSSSVFIADERPCEWNEVAERFSALVSLMNQSFLGGKGMTVTRMLPPAEPDRARNRSADGRIVYQWLDRMDVFRAFLESSRREAFRARFDEMREALLPIVRENPLLWREAAMGLSLMFLSHMNRSGELLARLAEDETAAAALHPDGSWAPEEAFHACARLAERIFDLQSESQTGRDERLVRELHEYIQRHLGGDLSLVRLAEVVYLSPAYLSRLYKQVTGTNLSDHVQQLRLETARRLLAETNLKIYEITERVGFESAAYFIRSFKKWSGATPQEYRNQTRSTTA